MAKSQGHSALLWLANPSQAAYIIIEQYKFVNNLYFSVYVDKEEHTKPSSLGNLLSKQTILTLKRAERIFMNA